MNEENASIDYECLNHPSPPPSWVLPASVISEEGDVQTIQQDTGSEVMENNCKSCVISWSDLPLELLLAIVQYLDTQYDLTRFRAVCKTWRRSASFSSRPQINLLSPTLPYKITARSASFQWMTHSPLGNSMVLVACSFVLLRSVVNPKLPPWLFTVEELNPAKVFLRKPLSRLAVEYLPEYFPKTLQLSHFQLFNIGTFYTLRSADSRTCMFRRHMNFMYKAVMFENSDCESTPVENYYAIVLYDDGCMTSIRLNNEEFNTVGSMGGVGKFDDIVNAQGKIYAVDRRGRAHELQSSSRSFWFNSVVNDPIGKGRGNDKKKRLAESCGELYLIYRKRERSFKVYKLNKKQNKWDEVEGVGDDRILFITFDGSFFASVKDFPGWKGNCIVYYRSCFPSYANPLSDADFDIFKTPNTSELEIAVFHFESGDCAPITSYPAYSNVFWPPPTWLASDSSSFKCIPENRLEDQISPKPISDVVMTPVSLQVTQGMAIVCEEGPSRSTDSQLQSHESGSSLQSSNSYGVSLRIAAKEKF